MINAKMLHATGSARKYIQTGARNYMWQNAGQRGKVERDRVITSNRDRQTQTD